MLLKASQLFHCVLIAQSPVLMPEEVLADLDSLLVRFAYVLYFCGDLIIQGFYLYTILLHDDFRMLTS